MDTLQIPPATAQAVATRQANLLKAYGLTQPTQAVHDALQGAHVRAQAVRFAASPSFAGLLQQAIEQHRIKRGAK
jgi:hypothetical protein